LMPLAKRGAHVGYIKYAIRVLCSSYKNYANFLFS
jgi:hypothetical protein